MKEGFGMAIILIICAISGIWWVTGSHNPAPSEVSTLPEIKREIASIEPIQISPITISNPVILIGDSHTVGSFGEALEKNLFETYPDLKNKFYTFAVTGSRFEDWTENGFQNFHLGFAYKSPANDRKTRARGNTPFLKISQLVKSNPELVIFALGTNDIAGLQNKNFSDSSEKLLQDFMANFQKIKSTWPQTKFVWIIPPASKGLKLSTDKQIEFFKKLTEQLKQLDVRVVDSNTYHIAADYDDRIHFKSDLGQKWAGLVAQDIVKLGVFKLTP